jgi:GNAT superfamily N-acetyltransferase
MLEEILPEDFQIRSATLEDAPAINALIRAYEIDLKGEAYHSEVELLQEWQRPDFHLDADAWVILAPDPDRPEASLIVGYEEVWNQAEHRILSSDGYVHPGYNGLGIGTVLLRLAEQRARQHLPLAPSARQVVIRSGIDCANMSAGELHLNEGYQAVENFWHMEIKFIVYEKELRPGMR